jgi:hypothetical protein
MMLFITKIIGGFPRSLGPDSPVRNYRNKRQSLFIIVMHHAIIIV